MNFSRWLRLVLQSIRRNKRDFVFSSIGIVIGIGTLFFFTALGVGIKSTVLERVFVVRQLEVEKPSYEMGMLKSEGLFGSSKKLDDATVDKLAEIEGVAGVYPKMKLMFPASARGGESILGQDLWAELIADGIPPSLVEVEGDLAFKDWENVECSADSDCAESFECGSEGICVGVDCSANSDACASPAYCHSGEQVCMMPVPFVVSPQLLEIYNGSIHTALGGARGNLSKMPQLSENALIGLGADVNFGSSYLGKAAQGKTIKRRARLVGFSDKAIQLGATMPIGYVKRLNANFRGEAAAKEYHSILVDTVSNDAVPSVAQTITESMGLALSDKYQNAQRAGLLILLVTIVFNLISMIILTVAAFNIMHTFLMIILERRRELALLRAVGATRGAIRAIVLGEATILGLFGGVVGVIIGWAATVGVDIVFQSQVGDFPFKPETLFDHSPWMFAASVGVAVFFCWIGALLPAIRASRIDPAAALAGR